MFAPEELELLVCGSKVLDFEAMEKATQYEGFEATDPVIRCVTMWGRALRPQVAGEWSRRAQSPTPSPPLVAVTFGPLSMR